MNRRKAIYSLCLLAGGAVAGFSGYTWYRFNGTPDFAYLDNHQPLLADLAEIIIPATDTPGAKAAMAHIAITALIKDVADKRTQHIFINGLKDVEHYALTTFNKSFVALSVADQQQVVSDFRDKGKNYAGTLGKIRIRFAGKPFFLVLKEYCTIAFCTSKVGATQALAYDYIPGSYDACLPLAPGQKCWATK